MSPRNTISKTELQDKLSCSSDLLVLQGPELLAVFLAAFELRMWNTAGTFVAAFVARCSGTCQFVAARCSDVFPSSSCTPAQQTVLTWGKALLFDKHALNSDATIVVLGVFTQDI